MTAFIYIALLIVLLILWTRDKSELFDDRIPDNWIRLYETFNYRVDAPDARWWEYTVDGPGYIKKDLKMHLKSYDIKVKSGNVQIWAIYPNETTASSSGLGVSGYGNAYTDPMRANPSKYRLITEAKGGDHIKGTLDFKATRIMVVGTFL